MLDYKEPGATMKNVKEKPRPERRASEAARLEKLINNLIQALNKIPNHKGKTAFMDRLFKIQTHAHNLAWALQYDANEKV